MAKISLAVATIASLVLSTQAFAAGSATNSASLLAPSEAAAKGDGGGAGGKVPCVTRADAPGKWKHDSLGAWIKCGHAGNAGWVAGGVAAAAGVGVIAATSGGNSGSN